jgi:tetratricopeptide (TPR) repeat protein
MKPFCFVLMPFGRKPIGNERSVDFDVVYERIIRRAIEAANLDPIRADEEIAGGIIHKPMYERLMLCDYAVADLTGANANVFYELGIRHGIRPHSTVSIYAKDTALPFDVASLRALAYTLDATGSPLAAQRDCDALAARLIASRNPTDDSPLFELVRDWPRPNIPRLKTDTFRAAVEYSKQYKDKLAQARAQGKAALDLVAAEIDPIEDADPAIVIDLYLSYRAVSAWADMVALEKRMSPVVARTVMVREQLGFALNRLGRRDEAETKLKQLLAEIGTNSETNGILGRVYKDRRKDAQAAGLALDARGHLRNAVRTYLEGFQSDIRDAYPGINAVTLMEFEEPVSPEQGEILPVLAYAVKRRLASGAADYWDHATLVELMVLSRKQQAAMDALCDALAHVREAWEPLTTADNLRLIVEVRGRRGEDTSWIAEIENALRRRAAGTGSTRP